MTTNYVQRRQSDLARALATVGAQLNDATNQLDALPAGDPARIPLQNTVDEINQVQDQLAAEQALLAAAAPDQLTDRAGEQTLLVWLAALPADHVAQQILDAESAEPLHRALGVPASVTPELAAAVQALRPGWRTTADAIRGKIGDAAFDDLIAIARRQRLNTPPQEWIYPFRDVAVLLPLRLETLFTPDGPAWTMYLRIIPDEASILRHDPVPTITEIRLLKAMWTNVLHTLDPATRGDAPEAWLLDDLAGAPWHTLCNQVGAARAAWLAGTFPPTLDADDVVQIEVPGATDHASPPNRVSGLPGVIDIWCGFNGQTPTQIASTAETDPTAMFFDVIGARSDDNGLVDQSDRWWVSWEAAKRVGLGVEVVLPDGFGPADITALYAVGVGDDYPFDHFAELIDSGELGRLPLGVPTNTVDGQPAASLGQDPDDWRITAVRRLQEQRHGPQNNDSDLGTALAGAGSALPPVPRTDQIPELDRALVGALGPALWGHYLRDVRGFGIEGETAGDWALHNLRPEGPLSPIRIAEQPYGLLPVSAMNRWNVSSDEDGAECEPRMLTSLLQMREIAAATADQAGNAVGADTARLLELIGQEGISSSYAYRLFFPAALWESIYTGTTGVSAATFEQAVESIMDVGNHAFDSEPARTYLAGGGYNDLELPLVLPTRFPRWYYKREGDFLAHDDHGNPIPAMTPEEGTMELIQQIAEAQPAIGLPDDWGMLPDSLMIRLMWYARILADAGVYRTSQDDATPLLEPIVVDDKVNTVLHESALAYDPASSHDNPAGELQKAVIDNLFRIRDTLKIPGAAPQLERALRATLDTAAYRVDPWFTGMATRRLTAMAGQDDTRFRLGAYGWVDGPILGQPGTTDGGLLHAPSHAQALTAVVLRDRYLTDRIEDPAQADRWSMQLESARIRLADEIADEVRIGCHIFESVGRQVERVVADDNAVRTLRQEFPLNLEHKADGRVCHGILALDNLLYGAPPVVPVSGDQKAALEHIHDSLDCYADLLVTEAVHQVVTGRTDVAGAAMDAAAGLATTPTLAFTETPLAADGLGTSVIAAVPSAEVASPGPASIADPSAAAAVNQMVGQAVTWTWIKPASADGPAVTASLADLNLQPIDTVVLSPDQLTALITHRLGGTPDLKISVGPRYHRRATDLIRSLGKQPAFLRDLAPANADPTSVADIAALDDAITTELLSRYGALRDAAGELSTTLKKAKDDNDFEEMATGLRQALLWGITPYVGSPQQDAVLAAMLDNTQPDDPGLLPTLVTQALTALQRRIDAAPELPPQAPTAQAMARAAESIGTAIAELAAPDGQLAVLAKVQVADLNRITGLAAAPDAALDDDWLPVTAAVRANISRLEAFQLEATIPLQAAPGFTAFEAWSNSPNDHWQTAALTRLRVNRTRPDADPHLPLPRFVAAYSATDLSHDDAHVAIGLIDSWTEAVPQPSQTTTAAFGFNAPGSRAPQAILIAVPPDISGSGTEMTSSTLVDIVQDTRRLARARAARADQLGPLLTAIPTTMFQAGGWTGVRLDTSTHL
jgi:hypothetical protein